VAGAGVDIAPRQPPADEDAATGSVRTGPASGTTELRRDGDMPKMKTHSGAKKRFKITGTGKIKRRRASRAHYNEWKSSTLTRRLKNEVVLSDADSKKIKKLLAK
jgi:large subunit ribosomal protein L35